MRTILYLISCTFLFSCSTHREKKIRNYGNFLEIILKKNHASGTILIYNSLNKTYNSNSFYNANKGYLPAGTFVIPHSLISLESNLTDLDKYDLQEVKTNKKTFIFRQQLSLDEAFKKSFDPYYQEITRKIGLSRMVFYLNKFHYPTMMINEYSLDNFWFYGPSKITPFEQIDFLQNLYEKKLPIKKSTYQSILKLMLLKETKEYKLYGKESYTDYLNNSWFIGIIAKNNHTYYFATHIESKNLNNLRNSYISSQEVTLEAFRIMNIL